MLTKRQIEILLNLFSNLDAPVSLQVFTDQFHLSLRSIQTDIAEIKETIKEHGLYIENNKNCICMSITNQETANIFMNSIIQDYNLNQFFEDQSSRISYIISRLLDSNDYLKSADLADEMYISRSQISNDIKLAKNMLSSYHLTLISKPYYGIKIIGKENDIRNYIIQEKLKIKNLVCDEITHSFSSHEHIDDINNIVIKILTHSHYIISDIALQNLILHIVTAVNRIKSGHLIHMDSLNISPVYAHVIEISKNILEKCADIYNFEFNDDEIFFLALNLYGKREFDKQDFITDEINKLILVVEESKEVELSSNDEYTIGERLGNGGFGQVYKYHNELLDLDFAIKVLDPLFSSEKDQANSEKRFFREAKMLFTLCHPNIVRIYDVGRLEGKPFIKMELVEGCDMNGLLKKHGNLTFENSLLPIIELLKGLEYAHHKGIIHRDLKPSNYMYSETCGYKIIDFGISAFTESEGYTKLTKTGEQIAGGLYTDPQLMENPTLRDCRSDIYSVGAIWHFLLTGRAPSGGDMRKNLIKNYNLDEDKTDLIIRCLAYKLEDRYNNCLELRKILESL